MPIYSVSGKTRKGKTSCVLAQLLPELIGEDNERYINCVEYLEELKKKGVEVSLPPQEHTISANIDFINQFPDVKAYEVNGFDLGVPNKFQKTDRLLPYGTYILDEAQRYYMQDESKHLPPWVLMMFQISGQYYIKFILISQRYIWIHKDIRALVDKFIYIIECKHIFKVGRRLRKTDKLLKYGRLISTTWYYKEFDDREKVPHFHFRLWQDHDEHAATISLHAKDYSNSMPPWEHSERKQNLIQICLLLPNYYREHRPTDPGRINF